jgi:hypothetical protein
MFRTWYTKRRAPTPLHLVDLPERWVGPPARLRLERLEERITPGVITRTVQLFLSVRRSRTTQRP